MSPCQNHTGRFRPNGYGYVQSQKGDKIIKISAHRLAWALHNGADPDGYVVMHLCDNRACLNPEHLKLGTQKENIGDMISKKRHNFGRPRGRNGRFEKKPCQDQT